MPLIYLGDEIGTLNDYSYLEHPDRAGDSRWVNHPATDWDKVARRHDPNTVEGRVYRRLTHLIALRKAHAAFGGTGATEFIDTGNCFPFTEPAYIPAS